MVVSMWRSMAKACLRDTDVPVGGIVFIGDRMTPDGNDYPAVAAGAVGMKVENPQDALGLMDALLQRVGASA